MEYALLKEDIETYILFGIAPAYFILLSIIQSRYLTYLKQVENKLNKKEFRETALHKIKKLKKKAPFILCIGAVIHTVSYLIFAFSAIRAGYFISIGLFYILFLTIAYVNFKLKGASILKDTGDFGGLPG